MQLFRRVDGAVAEFTTISYWASLEAMGAAMHGGDGGDPRRVAHLAKDPDYLLELPEYAEIAELHANDWRLDPRPPEAEPRHTKAQIKPACSAASSM